MLESNLKEEGADHEEIRKQHQQKAYPILQQMERCMDTTVKSCTPNEPSWESP